MYNWFGIWGSRQWNTKFLSVFAPNWLFSVKLWALDLWILSDNFSFSKTHKNSYTGPLCLTDRNMGITTKKYWVSVGFGPKQATFGKSIGVTYRFWAKSWVLFKTRKNSYTGPLCITDRNSGFLFRDPHIANRIYIMVSYISFYGFLNNPIFHSKSIRVRSRFYRKSPVWDQNWPTLRISWSWHPYSESLIHHGPEYDFLRVLNKLKFSLKIHRC